MKTLKSFFLIIIITLSINTSLFAWTSSNEGVCYTMDTLCTLSDSITYNEELQRYEIGCNIVILENDSLKITPGQYLFFLEGSPPYFWDHYGIIIFGNLKAIGQDNNLIYLGDKDYNFSSGNVWCGIQFYNTSQNGESILKYCILTGAHNLNGNEYTYNGEVGIFCENSSPIIDNCSFRFVISDYETGGGSAIACRGQSYPIVSYCKFKQLINSIAIWCSPWFVIDTINYPSPLIYGCNIMHTVSGFHFAEIHYDVAVYNGGFLDNCYLGAYNSNYADNTLGIPIDTVGDGVCNTTSTYWMKRFMNVDGVVNPRSDTLITGINETEIEVLPTTTEYLVLNNNYPNPFYNHTTIEFIIKEKATVNLILMDSKGNTVKTLIKNQSFASSKHQIKWYADNDAGQKVPDGIYFYKLSSGNNLLVKKAILIR